MVIIANNLFKPLFFENRKWISRFSYLMISIMATFSRKKKHLIYNTCLDFANGTTKIFATVIEKLCQLIFGNIFTCIDNFLSNKIAISKNTFQFFQVK